MAGGRGQTGERDQLELLLAIAVLGLAAVALGGFALRRLPSVGLAAGGPLSPLAAAGHAAARGMLTVLLVSVALALLASALRALRTWHTLRSRVAYAVLPPPEFEPRPEAIEAFVQQLLGARRRVLAWLDRPACGLRIRLTTTAAGRVLYV